MAKEQQIQKPKPYHTAIGIVYPVCSKCGETDHKYFHVNSMIGVLTGLDLNMDTLECTKCYKKEKIKTKKP